MKFDYWLSLAAICFISPLNHHCVAQNCGKWDICDVKSTGGLSTGSTLFIDNSTPCYDPYFNISVIRFRIDYDSAQSSDVDTTILLTYEPDESSSDSVADSYHHTWSLFDDTFDSCAGTVYCQWNGVTLVDQYLTRDLGMTDGFDTLYFYITSFRIIHYFISIFNT